MDRDSFVLLIPKYKIKPVFIEAVSNTEQERIKKLFNQIHRFDRILPVERCPGTNEYYLVGNYPIYKYFYGESDLIPCYVEEPSASKIDQLLKIFTRFLLKNLSNDTKQKMVNALVDHGFTYEQIVEKTILNRSQIKNFKYQKNIPFEIIKLNEANDKPASKSSINLCYTITKKYNLNENIANVLRDMVLKRKLTLQHLKKLDHLLSFSHDRFNQILMKQQLDLIHMITWYPTIFKTLWLDKLDGYLGN